MQTRLSSERRAGALERAGLAATRRLPPALRLRVVRRMRLALLRGDTVACPCCGGRFRAWMPARARPVGICPRCGAEERHRAVALWLDARRPFDGMRSPSVLHWAPEPALERRLRAVPGVRYTSADLEPGKAMRALDITEVDLPDAGVDVIVCIHVLEHVPDDARAVAELHRVLAPGGWALVLVPLDDGRERTLEDPAIATPEQRESAYLGSEHVRLYGRDLAERLAAPGFEVEVDRFVADLPAEVVRRHGLYARERMYVIRRARR